MGNLFSFIFLKCPLFSFIFFKTEKAIPGGGGGEFENGAFSTRWWAEPGLKGATPLVPVRATNRD